MPTRGAQVIETNSFGANRVRLARFGLDHQVSEINWRAAQVAREAVKGRSDVFVGGSVGPLSFRPADGEFSADDRKALFREQIGALLDGGCNLIFLETFTALDELLLALEVFQNLSNIPVVTSLAVSEEGRLVSGQTFPEAVKILRAGGRRYRGPERHGGSASGASICCRSWRWRKMTCSPFIRARGNPNFTRAVSITRRVPNISPTRCRAG